QGIITRDNVSVDVSAVAYFRVIDAVKSVVAIEDVYAAIDQIAQTTLRKVVGQHTLDETLCRRGVPGVRGQQLPLPAERQARGVLGEQHAGAPARVPGRGHPGRHP
ncbi:MAG TPA: SPFH domain-containing protein, partial [Euzebyales bacterium]|nr:SPFH domain-containing protein [Euzebyales bacterium]